ncbi:MAG: transcriptional regulator [Bacteroidetes bacterium]|jgi:transcriptional regulator with XRE-family HTH domain|nr:helix-turn-helix domain-containing protein [Bacteroidota bacterium]PTM18143.1 MAG: transcriptional regulator [Bacteroidota bacterium]
MHNTDLISTLKQRRETLQVTQEQLADISGVGLRTLKQLESGKGNPTLKTLLTLTDALGLTITLEVKNLHS